MRVEGQPCDRSTDSGTGHRVDRTDSGNDPHFSVLDLKSRFRARRYLSETIKLLPESPPPDLISRIWLRLSGFGGIRTRSTHDFAA